MERVINKLRQLNLSVVMARVTSFAMKIGRFIGKMMLMGIIFNILASSFYPEFPSKCPVLYGWFDGWLQIGEFLYKSIIKWFYSLFTGELSEFWAENRAARQAMGQQFISWLENIHF